MSIKYNLLSYFYFLFDPEIFLEILHLKVDWDFLALGLSARFRFSVKMLWKKLHQANMYWLPVMGHSALQHETIATIGITTFQQLLVTTQCEIGAIQRSCYVILIVLLWRRSYLCSELSVKPASSKCSYPAAGASIRWHVETGCFLDKSGGGSFISV